jgi:DNA polymerase III subunit delta'
MSWDTVECHPSVRKIIVRTLARGIAGNTLLIYGPAGAGQVGVSRAIAKTLLCREIPGDFCDDCSPCRRIEQRVYPDLFELFPHEDWSKPERKGATYSIDHLRIMQEYALIQPFEGDLRIFIIHEAHRMNQEGANCLLKILEEPYPHNVFMLLTDTISALLPTILSRCQKIRLSPMPLPALIQKLCRRMPRESAETIARLSGGYPDQIQVLIDNQYLEMRDEILHDLIRIREQESAALEIAQQFADEIKKGKRKHSLRILFSILLGLVRDGILAVSDVQNKPYLNQDRVDELQRLWKSEPPELLWMKFDKILDAVEGLDRNLNVSLLLTDLFLSLRVEASSLRPKT